MLSKWAAKALDEAAARRQAEADERAAEKKLARRSYAMALGGRLTGNWSALQSSADQELNNSLTTMRGRARELVRNAGYAKRAKVIVVNNVVGAGIGLQAQIKNNRGRAVEEINDAIESAWREWSRASSCHTGGKLHFSDLERACMGQVFDAGEVLLRKHYRAFGDSAVPLCLEVIEPERLADQWALPGPIAPPNDVRLGVEIDDFGRPQAYWLRRRHPGDVRTNSYAVDRLERVPADQIIHLHVVDRWPQVRGEPWMHAAARRLNDMDGYSEAEIVAARAAACYMGFRKTENPSPIEPDVKEGDQYEIVAEPGTFPQLPEGEDIVFNNPNRPNPALSEFMRAMLREVAAGVGVSYESLSRDYSQSNYSSSRLALLDDRDLWRQLQQWWIRAFREPLHREWLTQAVLAGAIPGLTIEQYMSAPDRYQAVTWKPRGWSWVDPTKEVDAAKTAVRSGMDTLTHIIAQSGDGRDLEDVINERKAELELLKSAGIETDTEVLVPVPNATPNAAAGATEANTQSTQPQQPARLQVIGGDR